VLTIEDTIKHTPTLVFQDVFLRRRERELSLAHREFSMTKASFTYAIMAVATGNSCSYYVGYQTTYSSATERYCMA